MLLLPGTHPNHKSAMWYPHYVAVNSIDNIFISDRTTNSLHVLDKNGTCVQGFGDRYMGLKRFNEPYGVHCRQI